MSFIFVKNEPAKYRLLQKGVAMGVAIPPTLFLSESDLKSASLKDLLNKFIVQNESDYYLVRSCVAAEDGSEFSYAGHFHSSSKVKAGKLLGTVNVYFKKKQAQA